MATVTYNYSQSSCDCYQCTDNQYPVDTSGKIPTNLAVQNCQIPNLFRCYNAQELGHDVEPRSRTGYASINSLESKYSHDFQKIECNTPQSCPKVQYATKDPRLVSAIRGGQVLTLDRPAFDSTVKLANVAIDPALDGYGQGYRTYSDIDAGYMGYYVDKTIEDPFFHPNFTQPADVNAVLYQDPMGNIKPQYYRKPVRNINVMDTSPVVVRCEDGCLSSIRDSLEQREDLMARQMAVRNQQRWESRWR